ncbi:MAG: hypothetical protein M3P51_16870 [Chloroflexota bacterium]|nr:hypothetical protein [Chloroflexota bacterium]
MRSTSGAIADRVRRILTELEDVRQDLLALSDDIWLNIDHNDNAAIEEGVQFKREYNSRLAKFDEATSRISGLIQQFTDVHIDAPLDEPIEERTPTENERIIRELDRETPHTLDEDFEYKRPYGFVLQGHAYKDLVTWRGVYKKLCQDLATRDHARFLGLPGNPKFISSRDNKSFSRNPGELRRSMLLTDGLHAEVNLSANSIKESMRALLEEFGIKPQELRIYLREDRDAEGRV